MTFLLLTTLQKASQNHPTCGPGERERPFLRFWPAQVWTSEEELDEISVAMIYPVDPALASKTRVYITCADDGLCHERKEWTMYSIIHVEVEPQEVIQNLHKES